MPKPTSPTRGDSRLRSLVQEEMSGSPAEGSPADDVGWMSRRALEISEGRQCELVTCIQNAWMNRVFAQNLVLSQEDQHGHKMITSMQPVTTDSIGQRHPCQNDDYVHVPSESIGQYIREYVRANSSKNKQQGLGPGYEAPTEQGAREIVQSSWFEYVVGLVIFGNLITIGVEAQMSLEMGDEFEAGSWAWVLERAYLVFYCLEAGLRLAAYGRTIFLDVWFLLDIMLVAIGILALFILPLFQGQADAVAVEKLLMVRCLRLLRLVRALRMFSQFRIMWRLVYGLLTAGQTIVSTTTLLLVSLFVFSCIAVELIAKDNELLLNEQTRSIVEKNFFGIHRSLMTLFQFVTLDSVAGVYFPLIVAKPYLAFFFLPVLIIVSVGLMNLVTAAVLENAMEHAAEEAEEQKEDIRHKVKDAIPALVDIFREIDKDGNGTITHKELENIDIDVLPAKFLQAVHAESMTELFEYLDVDDSGELTQSAFIEGVLKLCMLDMPVSAVQSLKLLRMILDSSKRIEGALRKMTTV
ncbi:Catsper1 [Symbiodinium natans]|uniref:Catsper1 protein n=1 Tax=Symbiodinium natans TaxID=878477 RepID=A0A812S500_9DINO|nr:Catsper1 [Symbiodinium natans]